MGWLLEFVTVLAATTAHLPDPFIRFTPALAHPVHDPGHVPPVVVADQLLAARLLGDVQGVEHLAVDVELKLVGRAVADADRT